MDRGKKWALAVTGASAFALPMALQKLLFWRAKRQAPQAEGNYFEYQGTRVHYIHRGHGRPLLLVHGIGMGTSYREWERNLEQLSAKYSVYAVDLPGFGDSDKAKMTYTAFYYANFLNAFIKEVIGRPVAVAASNTSAAFAVLAYTLERANFRRMVLIEPSGIVDMPAANEDGRKRRMLENGVLGTPVYLWAASRKAIQSFLETNIFYDKQLAQDPQVVDIFYYPAHLGGSGARYAFASFVTRFMVLDIRPHLKKIKIPLYVLWGEAAVLNPVENMDILRDFAPDAACYVFEKTKLLPHFENAKEFGKLMEEILK